MASTPTLLQASSALRAAISDAGSRLIEYQLVSLAAARAIARETLTRLLSTREEHP